MNINSSESRNLNFSPSMIFIDDKLVILPKSSPTRQNFSSTHQQRRVSHIVNVLFSVHVPGIYGDVKKKEKNVY